METGGTHNGFHYCLGFLPLSFSPTLSSLPLLSFFSFSLNSKLLSFNPCCSFSIILSQTFASSFKSVGCFLHFTVNVSVLSGH